MTCAREFNRVRTLPASSVTFTRLTAGMTDSAVFVVRHRAGKWICAKFVGMKWPSGVLSVLFVQCMELSAARVSLFRSPSF